MSQLHKWLFAAFVALASLSACEYSADPLPKRIVSNYEVAFPLIDTVIRVNDFFISDSRPISAITVSRLSPVIRTLELPGYLRELTNKGYDVLWFEPKPLVTNSFLDKALISFSCYALAADGTMRILIDNQPLNIGQNTQIAGTRLTNSDFPIGQISTFYINLTLTAKDDHTIISGSELADGELALSLGVKLGVKAGFSL